MKLPFAAALAGAALFATAANAQRAPQSAPLPDFPQAAQPGACYARVPLGQAPTAGGGQRVWTVEKGAGPTAVWRFDQRPVTGTTGAGAGAGLDWALVDCATGRSLGPVARVEPDLAPTPPADAYAKAPPPTLPQPRPIPVPFAQAPRVEEPMFQGPMAHGPMAQGPMRHGPMPHGPMLHGPMHRPAPHHAWPPHGGPHPGFPSMAHAGSQFASPFPFPPRPQAYAEARGAPRWFGDRFLTWSGKR